MPRDRPNASFMNFRFSVLKERSKLTTSRSISPLPPSFLSIPTIKFYTPIPAKAKVKIWSNFFNALRASTETDLMDEFGIRKACQWAGNSAATAMKNYALVRKSDFQDIGTAGKSDAKCAAIDASDAKCAAESASMAEQKTHKKSTIENGRSLPCMTVGVEGLEPPTLSV